MAAGGKAINLGELAIAIALKTGALEAGLKQVQNQLKDHGKKVQQTGADYDKLAIVAGVAFWKISSAIGGGVKAFNNFNNSMVGLKSTVQGTGNDFSQAQGFIDDFIKDGLVPANNAAMALKNLLSHGMSMDQAADVMNRFKDSAAFARQGSLSMGEAIQGATEGLKNSLSMMVDNAGVTENLSIMWDKYAQTIGKTAATLTDAEKIQAEYTGVMRATQFQIGDAAKYSEQFAGAQARATAETTKLKQSFGGALVPALNMFLDALTPIVSLLTTLTKNNPELVATLTLTVTAFLGIITVLTAVGAAVKIVTPAIAALKLALAGLMANPVVLALTALAAAAGIVATEIYKANKAQEAYNVSLDRFNKIKKDGVTKAEVPQIEEDIKTLEKLVEQYEIYNKTFKDLQSKSSPMANLNEVTENKTKINAKELTAAFKDLGIEIDIVGGNADEAKQRIDDLKKAVSEANKVTMQEFNDQAKAIAQKKVSAMETENLIKAYKNAEKGSTDWKKAQQSLAEQFPQFSTASGIEITAIEALTDANNLAVDAEWKALQDKLDIAQKEITANIAVKESELSKLKARKATIELERSDADSRHGQFASSLMDKAIAEGEKAVKAEKDAAEVLNKLANTPLEQIKGINPLDTEEFKSYENAALDSALKVLDHKKRMNQLSLDDEVKTLESISKKYIQTADERMDIDERIYEAKQAIIERDKKSEEDAIAASDEAMQKRTQSSLDWIESKKDIGELSVQDEVSSYDRIIAYHKEYLSKLLAGKKELSEQEQDIREEEEQQIKDFEQKKYDIQKAYQDELKQSTVDDINALSEGVESALRKRYEKEKELREQALESEQEDLDEWRDTELDRIDEVYEARIKAIEETAKAQKKSIQDEIDSLDQQVEEKDRGETDATELQKINAIKEQIQYEHDERNKLSLQKELDKLQKEREDRLYQQSIDDHKDALKKQIDDIEENADKQKEILQQQQESELARIQTLYDHEKQSIENRQAAWESYYDRRLADANLQAEAEKLIIRNNQNEIVTLLKSYGEDYKIVGQTLGEKLYDGFKPQVDAIRTLISNITAEINSVRDKALNAAAKVTSSTVTSGSSTQTSKSVNVTQTVNFNATNITPSEAARKQLQASRTLAQELG